MRENYWCSIELHEEEIEQSPREVIRELRIKEHELAKQLQGERKYQIVCVFRHVAAVDYCKRILRLSWV